MQPPYNCDSLVQQIIDGLQPKFLCFWGHSGQAGSVGKECLSQWYPATFEIAGTSYDTAEHYMMAARARLFDDNEAATKILAAKHPGEAKKLGREVRGFKDDVWNDQRFRIVVEASLAKFEQNVELGEFLMKTGDRVLVEASPQDRIWGIGLAQSSTDSERPENWRGLNLLGFALMVARDELRARQSP